MKSFIISILLLASFGVLAEESCEHEASPLTPILEVAKAVEEQGCPNSKQLPSLCPAIGDREKDHKKEFDYHYQRIIHESACVLKSDSEEVAQAKIQKMWNQFQDKLTCTNFSFKVQDGSILKYAVSRNFDDLLIDAALVWKVDLNKVDSFDNKTVLDYIKSEIEKYKGLPIEKELQSYYELLKSAGAKHKSEL